MATQFIPLPELPPRRQQVQQLLLVLQALPLEPEQEAPHRPLGRRG